MKNKIIQFLLVALFKSQLLICSGITYQFDGAGRFGDCVVLYCKSKYLSFLYNLPFYYKPFEYSHKLRMHTDENNFSNIPRDLKSQRHVKSGDEIKNNKSNVLFITDLFTSLTGQNPTDILIPVIPNPLWSFFMIDDIFEKMNEDKEFGNAVKSMLQPIENLPKINVPQNHISVAVHIRKGSGYDLPHPLVSQQLYNRDAVIASNKECDHGVKRTYLHYRDYSFPLKFPPNQYYVDQIKVLSELLNDAPLYVCIFTDDQNPRQLMSVLQAQCKKDNIIFSLSRNVDGNLVKEVWDMSQFDCLIRSSSHFPAVSQLMGSHKIIIRPQNYRWYGSTLVITETTIILQDAVNSNITQITAANINIDSLKRYVEELFK